MKVLGSAFYFGNQAEAVDARFEPFFHTLTSPTGCAWPVHRPFMEGHPFRRKLFLNELPDAWCGVVLSARATEFHHYVQQVGDVVNVIAQQTGPNPPVEVNFFCLRKDSGKGVYSNYYGSYAFGGFLADLWHSYRHFVDAAREAHLHGQPGLNDADDVREAAKPYSLHGKAQYAPLYSPQSFEQLVQLLHEVEEVRLTTYSVDTARDRPVKDRINNVHKVYRLKEGSQRLDRRLLDWIMSKKRGASRILSSGKTSFAGSVLGKRADGSELTIPFASALEDHLNFDYDEIGSFNVADIAANPCLAAMLAKVRSGVLFRP
jgi:hypothetical protein